MEEWDSEHRAVVTALRQLRANKEALSLATFARQAVLVRLCGDGNPLDAFLAFRAELQRWARGSRNEAAYAWSLLAPGDGVLDRLAAAAERVPGGFGADQRTIRRWGDAALRDLATQLLEISQTAGRRGRTLLSVEASGNLCRSLRLTVDVLNPLDLLARPPLVSMWLFVESGAPIEAEVDLVEHPSTDVVGGEYAMRRYYLEVALDGLDLTETQPDSADSTLLKFDLQVPEAPSVSVRFRDDTARHTDRAVEFMGYRGGCQVTLERSS